MTQIVLDEEEGVKSITFIKPDDWHLHVRAGEMLHAVLPYTAKAFGRAIIMPNLKQPITTVVQAVRYRQEILDALPSGSIFEPLMTLYFTDDTSRAEIIHAEAAEIVHGVKLYPAGATTNSAAGVTDIRKVYSVLETMQRIRMPLLVHGEVADPSVDIFDREAVFIEHVLRPLLYDFPELRVVFEHVTTKDGVDFVKEAGPNIAATITAHHLYINRNNILVGGIKPHNYCLPIAKREEHRFALVCAATSGNQKFFLGTDSAPHLVGDKESACGCAGCFTAPSALELYLHVFAQTNKLEKFESFASLNGPKFYGLKPNETMVTYEAVEVPWRLPGYVSVGDDSKLVPFTPPDNHLYWRRVVE